MPVQKSSFKISARPDLATHLLQILIPVTFTSVSKRAIHTLAMFWKILGNYLSKRQVGRVLAKSLDTEPLKLHTRTQK